MKVNVQDQSTDYKATIQPRVDAGIIHYIMTWEPQPRIVDGMFYNRINELQDRLVVLKEEQNSQIDNMLDLVEELLRSQERWIA